MEDYQPHDGSRIAGKKLRRDQDIWNLVGNFPLVISLRQTTELAGKSVDLTNGILPVKLINDLVLLETTCYDLFAAKHGKPSSEISNENPPKSVCSWDEQDTAFYYSANLAETPYSI